MIFITVTMMMKIIIVMDYVVVNYVLVSGPSSSGAFFHLIFTAVIESR